MNRKTLTVAQAATLTDLHPNTIYRHILKGNLVAYKLGGDTRSRQPWIINEKDLDKFIRGEK